MSYSREESFFGHVHRHPARMPYELGAKRDGTLVYVEARSCSTAAPTLLDTAAVVGNAGDLGLRPYRIPNVAVEADGAYTNNPPCGAMRGFGCVQAAFAHEAQMDGLAAAVGLDRVEIRQRNAMREGDRNIHRPGHRLGGPGRRAARERARDAAAARRAADAPTSAPCPAACPTPPTARASGAASATR